MVRSASASSATPAKASTISAAVAPVSTRRSRGNVNTARSRSAVRTNIGRPNGARPSSRICEGTANPASTRPRRRVRPALPESASETVSVLIVRHVVLASAVGRCELGKRRACARRERGRGRAAARPHDHESGEEQGPRSSRRAREAKTIAISWSASRRRRFSAGSSRDRWNRRPRRGTASTRRSRRLGDSA